MEKQFSIHLLTEYNQNLVARIMLLINKKQLLVNNFNVASYDNDGYNCSIDVFGNENQVISTVKLIRKQIGVYKALFKNSDNTTPPLAIDLQTKSKKILLETY